MVDINTTVKIDIDRIELELLKTLSTVTDAALKTIEKFRNENELLKTKLRAVGDGIQDLLQAHEDCPESDPSGGCSLFSNLKEMLSEAFGDA